MFFGGPTPEPQQVFGILQLDVFNVRRYLRPGQLRKGLFFEPFLTLPDLWDTTSLWWPIFLVERDASLKFNMETQNDGFQ